MKAINYKITKLNRFVYSFKQNPCDLHLSRTSLTSTNVKYDKNQKLIEFFFWKTPVEASKVIRILKKH